MGRIVSPRGRIGRAACLTYESESPLTRPRPRLKCTAGNFARLEGRGAQTAQGPNRAGPKRRRPQTTQDPNDAGPKRRRTQTTTTQGALAVWVLRPMGPAPFGPCVVWALRS